MPFTFDDATTEILRATDAEPITAVGALVTVLEGPDAGATHRIEDVRHRRALVGQSPACDVHLTDRSVSRRHFGMELDESGLRILDLGSRNGTLVAGIRVRDAYVRAREDVVLGATKLRIELDDAPIVVASSEEARFDRVLGASPEMRRLYPLFERLAGKDTHLLIEGEQGTGKELVAECIHDAGPRAESPFVVFDAAASPPEAIETEVFAAYEQARGGTLFIDEVGVLPHAVQLKLLRAIERRDASKGIVRVIAGTRRNLDRDIQDRRFREDLFLALATPRIELPPLRRRSGDVAFLARCFWTMLGGKDAELSSELLQRLQEHDWPGNVRELYFAIAGALASGDLNLGRAGGVAAGDFVAQILAKELPLPRARQEVVLAFERVYMQRMLDRHGGNVRKAAQASGIGRRYFQMLRAKDGKSAG